MKINLITFKTDNNNKIVISKSQKNKYLKIKKLCKKLGYKNYIHSDGNITVKDSDDNLICHGYFGYVYKKLLGQFKNQKESGK